MRFYGRDFRPRWWAFALALAGCAAGVALGNWQSRRAEERRALGERFEAALHAVALEIPAAPVAAGDYVAKRVAARGEFVRAHTVLIEYKMRRGRLGYEVVAPLRLRGSTLHVAVNRGWVAADPRPGTLPDIRTPAGEVRVEGFALARLPQALQLGPARGPVLQNLRLDEYQAATGLALQPIVIEQHSELDDGLLREWPRPDSGAEKNEMYALQWYSLAILSVVLFLVLSFRHGRFPAA
jgi:surfeit locus 1 family protein